MRRFRFLLVIAVGLTAGLGVATPAPAAPAPELNLISVRGIAVGGHHTCAWLTNGQARCWGANDSGQLGNGTTTPTLSRVTVRNPTDTGPLTGVAAMTVGDSHSCALLSTGQVRCWGTNVHGELGAGSVGGGEDLPVVVRNPASTGPLTGVTQISAPRSTQGFHTCATLTTGQARCWGSNQSGELGDGTNGTNNGLPVAVLAVSGSGPLTGVAQVSAADGHSCARLTNGQARCWGDNASGSLGNGNTTPTVRPVVVLRTNGTGPLVGVLGISTGNNHTCARVTGNQARCWGNGTAGGDGTADTAYLPQAVQSPAGDANLTNVAAIEVGTVASCAVLTNRQLRCWGFNAGDGIGDIQRLPVATLNLPGTGPIGNVVSVSQTGSSACLVLANGQARCWGDNGAGQLGDNSNGGPRLRPVVVRA